jgi:hypothetical protein
VRQFLSLRFWLTLLALVGVAGALVLVFRNQSPPPGLPAAGTDVVATHRVDLVAVVAKVTAAPGFVVADGAASADASLLLDANRTMVIKAGTPGDSTCAALGQPEQCVIAATLLGDAVLWFSIVPGSPGASISLPAITSLPEAGWAQLANHWVVRRASVIDRNCVTDTSSITDFIHQFGKRATSTFNLETQKLTKVVCLGDGVPTTDSLVPSDTAVVVPGTGVVGTDLGTNEGDTTP